MEGQGWRQVRAGDFALIQGQGWLIEGMGGKWRGGRILIEFEQGDIWVAL